MSASRVAAGVLVPLAGIALLLGVSPILEGTPRQAPSSFSRPSSARSIRDGAYTLAQARRGAELADRCTSCHGFDLDGERAPALIGREFTSRWEGRTLGELVTRIVATQPGGANVSGALSLPPLTAAQIADVLAYLLLSNGYPSGPAELPAALDVLNDWRVTAPGR